MRLVHSSRVRQKRLWLQSSPRQRRVRLMTRIPRLREHIRHAGEFSADRGTSENTTRHQKAEQRLSFRWEIAAAQQVAPRWTDGLITRTRGGRPGVRWAAAGHRGTAGGFQRQLRGGVVGVARGTILKGTGAKHCQDHLSHTHTQDAHVYFLDYGKTLPFSHAAPVVSFNPSAHVVLINVCILYKG